MLHNFSGEKIRQGINISTTGDNIIIPAITNGEIFIHEVIGDATATMTLTFKCGARVVATPAVDAGQGITLSDIPGMDGEPRFKCFQGEDFIINLGAAGSFAGGIVYSYKR